MKPVRTLALLTLAACALHTPAASMAAAARRAAPRAATARATAVDSSWRSPKNRRRPNRRRTEFIILHTTEGGVIGALEKLSQNGECHYVVDTNGKIYTIIDKTRIAYHAGLSMWNGQTSLDKISVGIEIVGYHDKDVTARQYEALRRLLRELKSTYKVPDEKVLTHAHVAYGNPHQWNKNRHRGRKRCAMRFAMNSVRQRLGLLAKPPSDPDLRARRLVDADPGLTRILYAGPAKISASAVKPEPVGGSSDPPDVIGPNRSAWDIARDMYAAKTTVYTFPDGAKKRGDEIKDWKREMQPGVRVDVGRAESGDENWSAASGLVEIGADGAAREIAGAHAGAATTFYFRPGAELSFKSGSALGDDEIDSLPSGTRMLVGYVRGGPVSAKQPVFSICGAKWNSAATYYLDPSGKLITGDKIDDKNIKSGSFLFYKP